MRNSNVHMPHYIICEECLTVYDKNQHPDNCPGCVYYELMQAATLEDLNEHNETELCPYCEANEKSIDEVRCQWCHEMYLEELGLSDTDNPVNNLEEETTMQKDKYFTDTRGTEKPSGQLSRDDQNRRLRESRLGFAEPSDDWKHAGEATVCLHDGQTMTQAGLNRTVDELGIKQVHVYNQYLRARFES